MADSQTSERALTVHELGFLDLDTQERPQIVSGVACLSDSIHAETLWERLSEFVKTNQQYRCLIIDQASPEWQIDENFDLSNHCREFIMGSASTDEVLTFVSNEAAHGLPVTASPWRIAVIHTKDEASENEQSFIAIWAHHSLIDGLEGLKFYSNLLDSKSQARPVESVPVTEEETPKSKCLVSGSCVRILARDVLRRPAKGPFSGARSAKRETFTFNWSRKAFKSARQKHDASFQEMLLAVLSDGLASFCEPTSKLRKLRTILPMGRTAEKSAGFTSNRHDVGFIDLPLTTSNWQARLKIIRRGLCSLQQQHQARVFPTILGFLGRLPSSIRTFFAKRWSAQANILISILPGGAARQRIGGVDVFSLFAQPALPPHHAVVIGAVATRENVCVTVQIDPEVFRNATQLESALAQAYAKILD